ncbi:uncharacterized protein [Diadema antillarum]|uniref:uncharacterized protein n=1 Tax=Diadema antillarum TaxID=105358 RepID=UPI003A835FA5
MAPASLDGPKGKLEDDTDEIVWCKQCFGRGERSIMRLLQISEDLAVCVCDNQKCTSLPQLAPGCNLIVERRATDIGNPRKKRKRLSSLPSSHGPKSDQSPLNCGQDCNFHIGRSQQSPENYSPLPSTSVVQWTNEANLCWLDVSMMLLVQNDSLRQCHKLIGAETPLQQLCQDFDKAQKLLSASLNAINQHEADTLTDISNTHCDNQLTDTLTDISSTHFDKGQPADTHDNLGDESYLSAYLREELCGLGELASDGDVPALKHADSSIDFSRNSSTHSVGADKCIGIHQSHSTIHQMDRCIAALQQPKAMSRVDATTLGPAVALLQRKRSDLLEMWKTKVQHAEGEESSPVTAIPALLRIDGTTEEHFSTWYRREFYCFACGFTNVTFHHNILMSVTAVSTDFSMRCPTMHHNCPHCHAEGQTSRLVYHRLPACPLVHFINGLHVEDKLPWKQRHFQHGGHHFELRSIIQYKRNPNHFVIWIRHPSRELWLKCDDLSRVLCHWQSQPPSIPPREVHILGWERREGHCDACVSLQKEISHIQNSSGHREDIVSNRPTPHSRDSNTHFVPLSKQSCPVIQAAKSNVPVMRDVSLTASQWNPVCPSYEHTPNELTISTPPGSPEHELLNKNGSQSYEEPSLVNGVFTEAPKSCFDHVPTCESKLLFPGKVEQSVHEKVTPRNTSHKKKIAPLRKGVMTGVKVQRKVTNLSNNLPRCLESIPPQLIIRNPQKNIVGSVPASSSHQRQSKHGLSLKKALHALNINSSLGGQRGTMSEKDLRLQPQRGSGSEIRNTTAQGYKVTKIKIPRQKCDSFKTFQQTKTKTFSGYLHKRDLPAQGEKVVREESRLHLTGNHGDSYQPSILLTPTSSVSSPSACSDSSSLYENPASLAGVEESGMLMANVQNFSSTMDALYQALDLNLDVTTKMQSSEMNFDDDDDSFLEGLLK